MKIKSMYSNKKGASAAILYVILAILVVGMLGIGFMLASKPTQQTQFGGPGVSSDAPVSSAVICNVEPYLATSITDAINPGTSIAQLDYNVNQVDNSGAILVKFGNQTLDSGGKKFNVGDKLEVIVTKSNYIDKKVEYTVASCGANQFAVSLYATDVSTLLLYNSDKNLITDAAAGGATNQTNSSTLITMDGLKITSPADKTSGDMVIAIESQNDTEVKDIILSGTGVTKLTSIPTFRKVESTGSDAITRWFEVPAVQDGASVQLPLTLEPESGKSIGGSNSGNAFYITVYTKQWFIDVDGTFKYGIENADGTTKYEDTYDYDFNIGR